MRDAIDLKRVMILVVVAVLPVASGHLEHGAAGKPGHCTARARRRQWLARRRTESFGIGYNPASVMANFMHGFLYFLPIYAVTMAAGGFWEVLFAGVRNHEVNEGFFVTSMLYALILPATTPLWQVAIGITFGVVVAKEMFGGTGKNFVNPGAGRPCLSLFCLPDSDVRFRGLGARSTATPARRRWPSAQRAVSPGSSTAAYSGWTHFSAPSRARSAKLRHLPVCWAAPC